MIGWIQKSYIHTQTDLCHLTESTKEKVHTAIYVTLQRALKRNKVHRVIYVTLKRALKRYKVPVIYVTLHSTKEKQNAQ